MTFLETIFEHLEKNPQAPVMREFRDGQLISVTARQLLALVEQAWRSLDAHGLKQGDRCALLASNSIRWAALDLAMMAHGLIVVPLYSRQAAAELGNMVANSTPSLICCADATLANDLKKHIASDVPIALFDEIFTWTNDSAAPPYRHADADPVTIIYTSGTSGEPKGVILNAGNVNHIIGCTNARLDQLMGLRNEPDQIFHYLPFCFAGSWILLLTALSRSSTMTVSADLTKLADEMNIAAPDYFMNVPTLLERVRAKVEESIQKRGGVATMLFARARQAYFEKYKGGARLGGALALSLARKIIFPAIRSNIGRNLKALICGSAPLSLETQLFYMMMGIPVLQVYGLTETTAVCTMDDPKKFEPGRVGPTIPGVEMKTGDDGEILVRGPNISPGYWRRPAESAKALAGGWFHTGDIGDVDADGNWAITGRVKNLIILNSGHNIAPEPIEKKLASNLPEAHQVVLLGNERSFLAALVTVVSNGSINGGYRRHIESVLNAANADLPHYKQVRAFHVVPEPFSIENGLLTANGKLKRDAIAARYAGEIESMYQKKPV